MGMEIQFYPSSSVIFTVDGIGGESRSWKLGRGEVTGD